MWGTGGEVLWWRSHDQCVLGEKGPRLQVSVLARALASSRLLLQMGAVTQETLCQRLPSAPSLLSPSFHGDQITPSGQQVGPGPQLLGDPLTLAF